MRDYPFFISPRFVDGTTVEGKVVAFLNGFNTVEALTGIMDKYGTGYADDRGGYGIRSDVAQRILDARPGSGFSDIRQIADYLPNGQHVSVIKGLGRDTFTDIVLAAIAETPGIDHRTVSGNFRTVNPNASDLNNAVAPLERAYDVIAFAKFQGSPHDELFPVQVARQEDGNFTLEHITNDYELFALVGVFQKEEGNPFILDVFHRSGLIPIQSFPLSELKYQPILLNQEEAMSESDFRDQVKEQEGTETEGGEIIEMLTADLKEGLIEFDGQVRKPDTLLWFDSTITFKSEVFMLPTFYAENWVRDLDSLIRVSSRITEQNHSNDGFWIITALSFLVPVVGPILGTALGITFLVIDNQEDNNQETKDLLADNLRNSLGDEVLNTFADLVREEVETADEITLLGLLFLSSFEVAPADPVEAIIQFMIDHKTVQTITIEDTEMTFNVWLTLPFFIQ